MEVVLKPYERDALCNFTRKDRTRYALNLIEVRVEKKRIILISTDGKRIISIEKEAKPEKADLGKYYISPVMLKAIYMSYRRDIPTKIIKAVSENANQTYPEYPDVDKVFPDEKKWKREVFSVGEKGQVGFYEIIGISIPLLSGLTTFIDCSPTYSVIFYQEKKDEVIVGKFEGEGYKVRMAIMPVNIL